MWFFLGNWNDGMVFVLHKTSFVSVIFKHCLQIMSLFSLEVRQRVLEDISSHWSWVNHGGERCLLLPSGHSTILMLLLEASRARPWSTAGTGNFSYPGEKTALFLGKSLCSISVLLGKQRAVQFLCSLPSLVGASAARWTKNASQSKQGNVASGNCWGKKSSYLVE